MFYAPYYLVNGAIELVFNTIQFGIALAMRIINSIDDLVWERIRAVRDIPDFVEYFINCGFVRP